MIARSFLKMGAIFSRPPVIIRWVELSLTVQCCSRGWGRLGPNLQDFPSNIWVFSVVENPPVRPPTTTKLLLITVPVAKDTPLWKKLRTWKTLSNNTISATGIVPSAVGLWEQSICPRRGPGGHCPHTGGWWSWWSWWNWWNWWEWEDLQSVHTLLLPPGGRLAVSGYTNLVLKHKKIFILVKKLQIIS